MIFLPDVNVWIALVAEQSVHHHEARQWFNSHNDQLAFCRITQIGFLRLLTNKHVMQDEVLSPADAWAMYGSLRRNARIVFVPEPPELHEEWKSFTTGTASAPNLWTDAFLAAFAESGGFTFVTFDQKLPARTGIPAMLLGTKQPQP